MKKRKIVLAALIAAVLVSSFSVSGTYARYVSTTTGADTARVAKWGFNKANTINIDLFKNSYLSSTGNTNAVVSDSTISAANDNIEKVVAPGTSGVAKIGLPNFAPETNYTIAFADNNSKDITNGKIVYYVKAVDYTDGTKFEDVGFTDADKCTSINDVAVKLNDILSKKVFAANTTDASSYVVGWKWELGDSVDVDDATNITDTKLGNGQSTGEQGKVELKLKVTYAQSADDAK